LENRFGKTRNSGKGRWSRPSHCKTAPADLQSAFEAFGVEHLATLLINNGVTKEQKVVVDAPRLLKPVLLRTRDQPKDL
jgi:hypothetical protein